MASMWTGTYPARSGVTRSHQAISDNARMPAEILKDAGFRTFAIWRNGWIRPAFGFSQGFEVYHSPRATKVPDRVRRERPTPLDETRSGLLIFEQTLWDALPAVLRTLDRESEARR